MASVSVKLPRMVTHPQEMQAKIVAATAEGLKVAMTRELGTIQRGGTVPANTGALLKSLVSTEPMRRPTHVEASYASVGQPAIYSDVMDKGRHPGRRLWHGWLLYGRGSERTADGWQTGWVNRRMRADVDRLASALKAERGGNGNYRKQAAFLLARKVARNIVTRGIQGREFFHRYARSSPERARFYAQIERDVKAAMRRKGVTG